MDITRTHAITVILMETPFAMGHITHIHTHIGTHVHITGRIGIKRREVS